jgi:hypothetical protein
MLVGILVEINEGVFVGKYCLKVGIPVGTLDVSDEYFDGTLDGTLDGIELGTEVGKSVVDKLFNDDC